MRWRNTGGAGVEDRRGMRGGAIGGGVGLIGLLLTLLFGGNLGGGGGGGGGFDLDPGTGGLPRMPASPAARGAPDPQADLVAFVGFVVDDVQQAWQEEFARAGRTYNPTKLVLFEEATTTGCGNASSATGPFYCPADGKVYLDLGFFRELQSRFGAPGDFAQAYVIAHEFGHHVQNLLGVNDRVRRAQAREPDRENELSVRLELQADCFAGVWGATAAAEQLLEEGDLEEGLRAAAAVGDDRLQRESTGRVNPESWTHGSSEQRVTWFRRGFSSADPSSCDTFSAS